MSKSVIIIESGLHMVNEVKCMLIKNDEISIARGIDTEDGYIVVNGYTTHLRSMLNHRLNIIQLKINPSTRNPEYINLETGEVTTI